MRRLTDSAYALPADRLAPALLGCTFVRILDGVRLAGVIVETEAYLGPEDKAAHSYGNRRTARTEPMFRAPGTSYVYFTYGMHHCMNVSAAREGLPHAVLIRALHPIEGLDAMRAARGGNSPRARPLRETDLCSGPGKLCQALSIDRSQTGLDLTLDPGLWIEGAAQPVENQEIGVSPRIGIDSAEEWVGRPLRFFLCGNPHVSGRRTSGKGPRVAKPGTPRTGSGSEP